jgi:hypothetical protein
MLQSLSFFTLKGLFYLLNLWSKEADTSNLCYQVFRYVTQDVACNITMNDINRVLGPETWTSFYHMQIIILLYINKANKSIFNMKFFVT